MVTLTLTLDPRPLTLDPRFSNAGIFGAECDL